MNDDEMGAIIHRMMRDLDDDDHEQNRRNRCEGCGAHIHLEPYQYRGTWLMYCAQCRALADDREQGGE